MATWRVDRNQPNRIIAVPTRAWGYFDKIRVVIFLEYESIRKFGNVPLDYLRCSFVAVYPLVSMHCLPSNAWRLLLAAPSLSVSWLDTVGKNTELGSPLDAFWNRKPSECSNSRQPLTPLTLASMLASAVYMDDRWPCKIRWWALSTWWK